MLSHLIPGMGPGGRWFLTNPPNLGHVISVGSSSTCCIGKPRAIPLDKTGVSMTCGTGNMAAAACFPGLSLLQAWPVSPASPWPPSLGLLKSMCFVRLAALQGCFFFGLFGLGFWVVGLGFFFFLVELYVNNSHVHETFCSGKNRVGSVLLLLLSVY